MVSGLAERLWTLFDRGSNTARARPAGSGESGGSLARARSGSPVASPDVDPFGKPQLFCLAARAAFLPRPATSCSAAYSFRQDWPKATAKRRAAVLTEAST